MDMIHEIQQAAQGVLGTAREAKENRAFTKLVGMVGSEDRANRLIEPHLQERGLTVDQWTTYRVVKKVMQQNPPPISECANEINQLAKKSVDDEFQA
jgi:hypothetical protein